MSEPFHVRNCVLQGGILSPYLFNIYIDDLSKRLNECKTGCINGTLLLNHLMYADDLEMFAPYSSGLQMLLNICSEYGIEADVKYNAIKSMVMIIRLKYDRNAVFPNFVLTGSPLSISTDVKYLGHYMTDDFRDDMDINAQYRKLYAQGNTIIRKFHMCTADAKVELFTTF